MVPLNPLDPLEGLGSVFTAVCIFAEDADGENDDSGDKYSKAHVLSRNLSPDLEEQRGGSGSDERRWWWREAAARGGGWRQRHRRVSFSGGNTIGRGHFLLGYFV